MMLHSTDLKILAWLVVAVAITCVAALVVVPMLQW